MPGEDNAALVARFLDELWNNRNVDIIDRFTTVDYVVHIPQGDLGREALKEVVKFYFGRFSRIQLSTELQLSVVSQDRQAVTGKVVTRLSWDTTLNLRDQSSGQEISRDINEVAGVSIDRIDNGQIAESWNMLDTLYWIINVQFVAEDPRSVRFVPAIKTCDPNPPNVDPPQCGVGQCCVGTDLHRGYCVPPQRCPPQ